MENSEIIRPGIKQKTVTINQLFYNLGMDRIHAAEIDQAFEEKNSREESKFLSRMSRVILGAWDIASKLAKLPAGECLVINNQGELFQGRVKTEKLQKLPEKVAHRNPTEFDDGDLMTAMRTKSSVNSPSPAFKNGWALSLKAPKQEFRPIVWAINERLSQITPADLDGEMLSTEVIGDYTELTIKDFPFVLGIFTKTGTLYYYISDGEKIYVK